MQTEVEGAICEVYRGGKYLHTDNSVEEVRSSQPSMFRFQLLS